MTLRVVIPPAQGLVTLDQAKAHLRVYHDEDDALIKAIVLAATGLVEADTQRRYVSQTLEWTVQPCGYPLRVPVAPVAPEAVESFSFTDVAGVEHALTPPDILVYASGETSALIPVPSVLAATATVRFAAGTSPDEVSPLACQACLLLVGHLYENREAVMVANGSISAVELPMGVKALLTPERWV